MKRLNSTLQVTTVELRYEKTMNGCEMRSVKQPVEQLLDICMLIKFTRKILNDIGNFIWKVLKNRFKKKKC